jgi:hypothetical protein
MKPLKEDQQPIHICRTVLRSWRQTQNPLHEEEGGLDASNDRGLTERSGEVFSLDILSHRMSVKAMFRES